MNRQKLVILLLLIFYLVGTVGLSFPNDEVRALFLSLTPFNLLLTLGLMVYAYGKPDRSIVLAFLASFLVGFSVELAGVHTGLLFGNYWYGDVLGWKIFEVPVLIGVNWFILAMAAYWVIPDNLSNWFVKSLLGAALMTALDYLIEPVAMELDFWNWEQDQVPLRNYFMWFVTGAGIEMLLHHIKPQRKQTIGYALMGVQAFFFLTLRLTHS